MRGSLIVLLACLCFTGVRADAAAAADIVGGETRIELLGYKRVSTANGPVRVAKLRLENKTKAAVYYSGYGKSPFVMGSKVVGDKWQRLMIDWCGTGLTTQTLSPGKSIEFELYLQGVPKELRVGVLLRSAPDAKESTEIWSDVLTAALVEVDEFPEVQPKGELPKGFEWTFRDGPDFYVWRASRGKDVSAGAGMYFGTAPDFHPPKETKEEKGNVASYDVKWRVWAKAGKQYRETVFDYKKIKVHVSVFASEKKDIEGLLKALEKVEFEKRTKEEKKGK